MKPTVTHQRNSRMTGRALLAMLLPIGLLLTFGCSGSSSSPTAPPAPTGTQSTVTTQWGSVSVQSGSCTSVDLDLLAGSIDRAYSRAREIKGALIDSVRLDGLVAEGVANLDCGGVAAAGCYTFKKDRIQFRCGVENVMEHELQHRFCDRLDCPCDCKLVDHSPGYDLNCGSR